MGKKRFYYAVASFMRKNGTRTMTSVHSCFEGTEDEDELKFYPIFKTIKCVENYFKDTDIIPSTIIIENVTEISEKDYNAIQEYSAALKKEKEGYRMEKVFKQIDKIIIIIKVLCMEGKIQKQTYDEIRLSLVDMEDELNKLIRKEG